MTTEILQNGKSSHSDVRLSKILYCIRWRCWERRQEHVNFLFLNSRELIRHYKNEFALKYVQRDKKNIIKCIHLWFVQWIEKTKGIQDVFAKKHLRKIQFYLCGMRIFKKIFFWLLWLDLPMNYSYYELYVTNFMFNILPILFQNDIMYY